MEVDHKPFEKLLEKYLEEKPMTADELRELQAFIQDAQFAADLDALLHKAFRHSVYAEARGVDPTILFQRIKDGKRNGSAVSTGPRVSWLQKWYIPAAAAALIFLSVGLYIYSHRARQPITISEQWAGRDIEPGGNKAFITLEGGRKVALSDRQTGIRLSADGIAYLDGSSLNDVLALGESAALPAQLKLTTPKGGQYQLVLPDGTQVWLNAGSTLSYLSRFTHDERRVILEGEGYFEVTPHPAKPFVVQTTDQEVTVLGTHFNVQSYAEDNRTTTTLLEGAVRVAAQFSSRDSGPDVQLLTPNQQSVLVAGANAFQIATVDPAAAIAWKNGLFQFENATIQTVMRQIARWYDLEIEYEGNFDDERFNGKVYRDMTLSQVLNVLSFSKIQFQLEDRTLIILTKPNQI